MTTSQTDHLGNVFESISKMCEHYGISQPLFTDRRKKGWDLERILTQPVRKRRQPKTRKAGAIKTTPIKPLVSEDDELELTCIKVKAIDETVSNKPEDSAFELVCTHVEEVSAFEQDLFDKTPVARLGFWNETTKEGLVVTLDDVVNANKIMQSIYTRSYENTSETFENKDAFVAHVKSQPLTK